jgi:hypothetical protein
MRVELLWFQDCPNHEDARSLLREVLRENGLPEDFEDIDATDPERAEALRFAGSPSIRIDGVDVEPGFEEPEEYVPGCRLYRVAGGRLQGTPLREWIAAAVKSAMSRDVR